MKKFFVSMVAALICMLSLNLFAAECTGLSFDAAFDYYVDSENYYYPNQLVSYNMTSLPLDYAGAFMMAFYPDDFENEDWTDFAKVGTYNLGTGNNANYSTCNQCVLLYRFAYDSENDTYVSDKDFFQKAGTIQITKTDFSDEDYPYYQGILSLTLAEVEIMTSSPYTSKFVEGGECYEIESGLWSNFEDGYEAVDPADTGDTEVPGDTGDTEVPGDTGDTEVPGDTGDTEVPGDTGDTEVPDTGSDAIDTDTSDPENPGDTDGEPADTGSEDAPIAGEDDDDEGGCTLLMI